MSFSYFYSNEWIVSSKLTISFWARTLNSSKVAAIFSCYLSNWSYSNFLLSSSYSKKWVSCYYCNWLIKERIVLSFSQMVSILFYRRASSSLFEVESCIDSGVHGAVLRGSGRPRGPWDLEKMLNRPDSGLCSANAVFLNLFLSFSNLTSSKFYLSSAMVICNFLSLSLSAKISFSF